MAYPHQVFDVQTGKSDIFIYGAPDYLAQLLDKLIANAEDFSMDEDAIEVSLVQKGLSAVLTVSNRGPLLPDDMSDQLLNSMVSVRSQQKQTKPHLGLGLFIARLITQFHQGEIELKNRLDQQGVEVVITLPVQIIDK